MKCPRREEISPVFKLPDEDSWRDGRCTFCGSIDPEDFMNRVRSGEEIGPTDKNYKVYVGKRDKFYFQHLSVEQRKEFVELLNKKKINIGDPGRFYVLPFFCEKIDFKGPVQ